MKKHFSSIVKVLIFLFIGVLLFCLAYRGQDFSKILDSIKEVRWSWIIVAGILSFVGHYSRAIRWKLLLEPFGYKPRNINLFFSVIIMYLTNMAIPRMGEVVRCGIVAKYEKIPFARALGTVVTERIADFIILFLLTIFVFINQSGVITSFVDNNPQILERINSMSSYIPYIVIIAILLLIGFVMILRFILKSAYFAIGNKIRTLLQNFKEGLLTILNLKSRWKFLFHSLFVNFVYFYTIYLGFKAFAFTEDFSLTIALTLFVLGTFGILIPSPGGMGTWHFIIIETLVIYGVNKEPDAGAYALVMHGVQDILFIVVGFVALMVMPILNNNYQPVFTDENQQDH